MNRNLELFVEHLAKGEGSYECSKQDSAPEHVVGGQYRLFMKNEWLVLNRGSPVDHMWLCVIFVCGQSLNRN